MTSILDRLEADIEKLSLVDQLWLMERLAHCIRERAHPVPIAQESDLIAMANDPAIQQELQRIEAEFTLTEADGLDADP
jgi:hypothetical protein